MPGAYTKKKPKPVSKKESRPYLKDVSIEVYDNIRERLLPFMINGLSRFIKNDNYKMEVLEFLYPRLYSTGMEVYQSEAKFSIWMETPTQFFNNKTPFELLGIDIKNESILIDELMRIDNGIFV